MYQGMLWYAWWKCDMYGVGGACAHSSPVGNGATASLKMGSATGKLLESSSSAKTDL